MRTIPKTMRAAAIDRFGPPEALTIHELPVPEIDTNEILIDLDTAGVGPWDADIREGWTPGDRPSFPLVPGTDGEVAHVPKVLDVQHAGAMAATGLTALQGIDDALHVKRGETVVIYGASGGVG